MSHELKEDALAGSGAHSTLVECPAAAAAAAQIGPSLNPILINESPRGMGRERRVNAPSKFLGVRRCEAALHQGSAASLLENLDLRSINYRNGRKSGP